MSTNFGGGGQGDLKSEQAWHHVMEFDVRWADVDRLGHVNHLSYLRWCEDARNEHAIRMGLPLPGQGQHSQVVVSLSAEYFAPLRFGSAGSVRLRVDRLGRTSLSSTNEVLDSSGQICARVATTTVMCNDADGRPRPWTAAERLRILGG